MKKKKHCYEHGFLLTVKSCIGISLKSSLGFLGFLVIHHLSVLFVLQVML